MFHCAGYAHAFASSDTNLCWRVNYEGTSNLLTSAAEAGVRRFVFFIKRQSDGSSQEFLCR